MRRALLLVSLVIASIATGSAAASETGRLDLRNTTLQLGATYTITGRTGAPKGKTRATGWVRLTGRLNGGPWRFLRRTRTHADGTYRMTIKPTVRGRLELRLATPDHYVAHVVLTVI